MGADLAENVQRKQDEERLTFPFLAFCNGVFWTKGEKGAKRKKKGREKKEGDKGMKGIKKWKKRMKEEDKKLIIPRLISTGFSHYFIYIYGLLLPKLNRTVWTQHIFDIAL
jgi:hypothetical protein